MKSDQHIYILEGRYHIFFYFFIFFIIVAGIVKIIFISFPLIKTPYISLISFFFIFVLSLQFSYFYIIISQYIFEKIKIKSRSLSSIIFLKIVLSSIFSIPAVMFEYFYKNGNKDIIISVAAIILFFILAIAYAFLNNLIELYYIRIGSQTIFSNELIEINKLKEYKVNKNTVILFSNENKKIKFKTTYKNKKGLIDIIGLYTNKNKFNNN